MFERVTVSTQEDQIAAFACTAAANGHNVMHVSIRRVPPAVLTDEADPPPVGQRDGCPVIRVVAIGRELRVRTVSDTSATPNFDVTYVSIDRSHLSAQHMLPVTKHLPVRGRHRPPPAGRWHGKAEQASNENSTAPPNRHFRWCAGLLHKAAPKLSIKPLERIRHQAPLSMQSSRSLFLWYSAGYALVLFRWPHLMLSCPAVYAIGV